ncbi:hypothetical protein D3C72_1143760 [compost metagenome]
MTPTTRSNSFGWFRNRAWTCTPALRPEKKTANRRKAASGAPVFATAVSSCGASRVNSSRPRAVRVAGMRPWCQLRMVSDTVAGSEKPIRFNVSSVPGSFSTPVKTRLP